MSGDVIDDDAPRCPHDVEIWEEGFAFPSHRHTVLDARYWCQVYCSVCGVDWSERHEVGCVYTTDAEPRFRYHSSCLTPEPWPPTFGPAPADCHLASDHATVQA